MSDRVGATVSHQQEDVQEVHVNFVMFQVTPGEENNSTGAEVTDIKRGATLWRTAEIPYLIIIYDQSDNT